MNALEEYFRNNTAREIRKWTHYFEIYDKHFSRYRGREITVLEIGVSQGGSLQMWKDYFGDKARIYGVDVDPRCKTLEEKNIHIFIGSQSDRKFLRQVKKEMPPIDILIDDGGHTMKQQIVTYEELFDHVKPDGVYLCEDLQTSYWVTYGGGHRRHGTFIEFSKRLIDKLHAWHSEQSSLKIDSFTRSVHAMHFYDSVLVIEKRPKSEPIQERTGFVTFDQTPVKSNLRKIVGPPARHLLELFNKFLRVFRLKGFIWR